MCERITYRDHIYNIYTYTQSRSNDKKKNPPYFAGLDLYKVPTNCHDVLMANAK